MTWRNELARLHGTFSPPEVFAAGAAVRAYGRKTSWRVDDYDSRIPWAKNQKPVNWLRVGESREMGE